MNLLNYSRSQLEQAIDEWVICRKHSERNRQILKRALIDEVTQERIAEEFGLSVRGVQNIIYKTQEQLFRHL